MRKILGRSKSICFSLELILVAALLGSVSLSPANASTTCNADGSNVTLVALHRPSSDSWTDRRPFYADVSGGASTNQSGYIGYSIDGTAVDSVTDLWMKINTFTASGTGGSPRVALALNANQSDAIPVRTKFINPGTGSNVGSEDANKRVAYFYLQASAATTDNQSFTVSLYNGSPNLGGTLICSATDGFSDVQDTLSANANKVTSVQSSATSVVLGSSFTVTAIGQTGKISQSYNDDEVSGRGVFATGPSISNSWNPDAFTLTGIRFTIDANLNLSLTDDAKNYNFLRYYPASDVNQKYEIIYYFVAREVASATGIKPAQNIASGGAPKYTGTYSGTAENYQINVVKNALSLNKSIVSVTGRGTSGSNSLYDISYRLTLKNSASVNAVFDYIKDEVTLNNGATGGLFVSPTNGTTLSLDVTSTSDTPTGSASISGNKLTLNFNGPISLSGGNTRYIDYTIRISYPTANVNTSGGMPIENSATGYIGSEPITSTTGVNAVTVNIDDTFTLTINGANSGYVNVDAKQTDNSACSSTGLSTGQSVTCTFYTGTALTLTAVSASATISSWGTTSNGGSSNTGNCATSNAVNPCTIVILGNSVITPSFSTSYTVSITGVTNVAVSEIISDVSIPVSCTSGTCSMTYASGSSVTLNFTADTGYTITSISSNAATTTPASTETTVIANSKYTYTVNSNFTITVVAGLPKYGLDVSASAGGDVDSNSSYILNCTTDSGGDPSGTCGALINDGTSITLTATASSGKYFGGWGGDGTCTGTTNPCTFIMNQNRVVNATFTANPGLVVVVVGSGTVSANSGAISNCGTDALTCSDSYTLNSTVTLTASPASGYKVTWSGDTATASGNTSTVSMSSSKSVTATFAAIATSYTLTGPSTGAAGSESTNFTVTPNGPVDDTTIVTITYGGSAQGALTTQTVTFTSGSSSAQTFNVTPLRIGDLTLTATNDKSLSNPAALTYISTGSYTFTGPETGLVNNASTNFTLTPSHTMGDATTVTITYGGDKGTLSTATATFNAGSSSAVTFTVTPNVTGTLTLTSTTNNSRLTNPAALNYVVTSSASPSASTKAAEVLAKDRAKLKGEATQVLDSGTEKFCIKAEEFSNKSDCESRGGSPIAAERVSATTEYIVEDRTLRPSTTYYVVFHGKAGGTDIEGEVRTFRTKPEVVTNAGTSVTTKTAKLNATVSEPLDNPKFCYKAFPFTTLAECLDGGLTSNANSGSGSLIKSEGILKKPMVSRNIGYLRAPPKGLTSGSLASETTYSLPVSGLNPSTTYYFIIYGSVSGESYDGGVKNFTTPATDPVIPIVRPGPVISSISKSLACYTGTELTIIGDFFEDGRVTFEGSAVVIRDITNTSIKVSLPLNSAGRRTIVVTTPHGVATTYIEFVSIPRPVFQPIRFPYLSQGLVLSLPFVATNTTTYGYVGKLPSGLSMNPTTGEIFGTATENGVFVLVLKASNICGETQQVVELDIDAPTPNAISHRINFLPGSCTIPDSAKASLEAFLEKAKGVSPRNIIPEIYVSGGGKASDPNSPIADCRQEAICDFLLLENLFGEVLSDVFSGAENRVEIIVYWPRPNDDL